MDEMIVALESVRHSDVAQVGAKAATLGTLLGAGFPVPRGLCVTTEAFRLALGPLLAQIEAIVAQHDLPDAVAATSAAGIIDDLLAGLSVPEPVMNDLLEALPDIGGPETPFAVRSSATAEDSAEASFAGQYRSVIGVRCKEALHDAIVAVWKSFFSAHALAARAAAGRLGDGEAMAVLILPIVSAECAGVCFSVDPVHGRWDRAVITAAWGLGAGVVDGSVTSDTYWVRRDGATEGFELEERRIAEQRKQVALDPNGGSTRVDVPEQARRAACLPDSWAERVAQFGVAAEVLFDCPQDVEWAIADGQVWVLQSRPITALPPELAQSGGFPVTWENEDERRLGWVYYAYLRYALKPLEIDYVYDREAGSLESALYRGGDQYERTKIVNGRLYTSWAVTDQPAGDRRIRRAAMADLADRLYSQGITPWEHWGPEIIRATERLSAFDRDGADGAQLAVHLEDARGAFRRHWPIHGSRLFASREPLYAAFEEVAGVTGSAAKEAAEKLLEGEETITTRLIDGVYALACTAREIPAVAALIADPPPDVLDQLGVMPEAGGFCHQLAEFLDIYGDRTGVGYGSDGTICVPTWREDPALALRIVAPYLNPTVQAPALARQQAQAERDAAIEKVCDASDDRATVTEFRRHLAFARRAAAVMEEHNHYIDQMMNGQLRQAILAAARWLAEKGILTDEEDVFWLHYDEILAALRAGSEGMEKGDATADVPASAAGAQENVADLSDIIFARKAQHAEWEKLDPPPLLGTPHAVLSRRSPLQDEVTPAVAEGNDRLRGLGASPGCGRGRARVVASSWSLPDLSPGDVLVTENVGPRWTPLIPMLSGLVLDAGAVGQHHAITAREYGVPAVVGTRNATRCIPDGAWVVVDGTAGTVDVQDAPQECV